MTADTADTVDTVVEPVRTFLPEAVSTAIAQMIAGVMPGVVQVWSGRRGAGSGIIWRADGGILTNYHVIAASERGAPIQVQLPDGRSFDAKVTSRNPSLDLAMLQIAAQDLPAVPVGDSSHLRVGELVFAIGHPWGQKNVVTAGIVSGVGAVPIRDSNQTAQFIRSDVQLAPGNSGGPLLNAQGTVVGINAMIFGGDLAVAIPSHVASAWVAGPPSHPVYLGVQVQPVELPATTRQGALAARAAGLLVVGLSSGGPAAQADVMIGDVLLDIDDTPVADAESLLGALAQSAHRGRARLRLLRGGSIQAIDTTLGTPEQSA